MTERSQLYESICDASPDGIFLVNRTGEITYTNARVEDLFGYAPEELIGEPIEKVVPTAKREEHIQLRDAYLENPTTRSMGAGLDLRARRKDGSTFPVDISLSPIHGADGFRTMAVARDISDRESLQRKYQTILKAVPDAVIVAETETGKIIETNEQVVDLFGYNSDELVGEHILILHPSGEKDRYENLFETHIQAGDAIFTELPDGSDIYIETKEEVLIPVEINARVFELNDRQVIAGVFRDVSDRKEHERQLEELHAVSREFLQAEDPEDLAQIVAEATESILGFDRVVVRLVTGGNQLSPVAMTYQASMDLGERPTYPVSGTSPAAQAYETGEPLVFEDIEDLDDGYDRDNVGSAVYVPMTEYGVISIVDPRQEAFNSSDVEIVSILAANARTALKRLDIQRDLERQVERLDKFAGIVSHDLRNPLNVAHGWLDIIAEEQDREELQRVRDALERMDEIITDTLTLSRAGEVVGEKEAIDLGQIAEESWNIVSPENGRVDIKCDQTIYGDRDRIRHLLENLFRNAIEHGGDDVAVKMGEIDETGFYVEDDGPGIPEEVRGDIFGPGFSTSVNGTGFGLSIVKEVVEAHDWEISITESAEGGARFEIAGVEFTAE